MGDMIGEMLEMVLTVAICVAIGVAVIAGALMGVDHFFDTNLASSFLSWAQGLLEGLG